MPSTKKRINLTVPDIIYEQLQQYKDENGISNDASACLQLIVQQLRSIEQSKLLTKAYLALSAEEIAALSVEGNRVIKSALEEKHRT